MKLLTKGAIPLDLHLQEIKQEKQTVKPTDKSTDKDTSKDAKVEKSD